MIANVLTGSLVEPQEFNFIRDLTKEARIDSEIHYASAAEMVADYFATTVTVEFIKKATHGHVVVSLRSGTCIVDAVDDCSRISHNH